MEKEYLLNQIQQLISPVLKKEDVELFEIIFRPDSRGKLYLRLLVDKPSGGISLGECARLNEEISQILDTNDLIQSQYILEISSPGLDRPLSNYKDFKRCKGRDVKIILSKPIDDSTELTGNIEEVKEDSVLVQTKQGTINVPFGIIVKGKQLI